MAKKNKDFDTISENVIKEIENHIKYGLEIKEFNKKFHEIVTKSIGEYL